MSQPGFRIREMQSFWLAFAVGVISIGVGHGQLEPCNTSFTQAIADEGNLLFLSSTIRLGGFTAKLPDPNIGITVFAPTNNAMWKLLTAMNLGFWDLIGLTSHMNGILLYHVLLGGHDVASLLSAGSENTMLGLSLATSYNLNFTAPTDPSFSMNVKTMYPANNAGVQKSIPVCNSFIHVINEVLLPTRDNIGSVPDVDLNMLTGLVEGAPPPTVGNLPLQLGPVDPTCTTTFMELARNTSGMDVLVQAIQRAGLANALPSPGAGLTVFAPTNAAFLAMMQALHLDIASALALGDKLQSILLYHMVKGALLPAALAQAQKMDTLLGMDLGTPYPLTFSTLPSGKVGVSGLLANNTGTIVGTLPICSSLVHIVDVVLIPAASLDAVPHPKGGPAPAAAPGPAGLVAQGPAEGPLLSPVPRAVPLALPPQSACGQSLLSAADANGLSFLTQALDAAKLIDAIPDPGAQALTFFAPVNGAFYDVMTNADFGLDELAGLGDRFKSVLLYHIVPTGAYSLNDLVQMGQADTLLGTTIGTKTPLEFSATPGGWALVKGIYPNNTARILKNVTVCQSVMYMVDHVLIPAPDIVHLPLPYPKGAAPGPSAGCSSNILDVLNLDVDLTLAFTLLDAAGLTDLASDPSLNLTLLVPTNQAILDGLGFLNLTLASAEAHRDKLISMIRYHIVMGARTADQLAAAGQLPTYLGDQYPLRFEATRTGLVVTGQYSQAQTQGTPVPACASLLYKIDVLLLPAKNLESVPGGDSLAPGLPPAGLAVTAPAGGSAQALPDGTALAAPQQTGLQARVGGAFPPSAGSSSNSAGVAFGAGYLSGCQVTFSGRRVAPSSTTNSEGRFAVPLAAEPQYVAVQGATCTDTGTQLPPPFPLAAIMPAGQAGVTLGVTVNAITTGGYIIRQHIGDPAYALYATFLGGTNFRAEDLYTILGTAFGLTNPSSIGTTDYLANIKRGDAGAVKLQSLNAILQASMTIGSQMLVAQTNATAAPITVEQATQALFLAVLPVGFNALTAGSGFSTSNPDTLVAILQKAADSVGVRPAVSNAAIPRRILLQSAPAAASAPAQAGQPTSPVAAAAKAAAELNRALEDWAKVSAGFDGTALLQQMQLVMTTAQQRVAPAAARMFLPASSPGALSVDAFLSAFTGPSLQQMITPPVQGH